VLGKRLCTLAMRLERKLALVAEGKGFASPRCIPAVCTNGTLCTLRTNGFSCFNFMLPFMDRLDRACMRPCDPLSRNILL